MYRLRKAPLVLFIVLLLAISGCGVLRPHGSLTNEQANKLELVEEIKAFERKLGFNETDNFKTYSDETEAYDYYFYTSNTALPYSLDDSLLQAAKGKPESAFIDLEKYDVFSYSIEAIAGVKTPVTKSLLRAPMPRFIYIIFHEDWHEQMNSPLGIEEPCGEIVSYAAAMHFTEEKFGQDSAVYKILREEFDNKLEESRLYQQYYEELNVLYSRYYSGGISEAETLSRKAELLESMGNGLRGIWGAKPRQLNNAFIAFRMTYLRHFSLMYRVFSAVDFDLVKTMAIFQSVPGQGAEFDNVEELKSLEAGAINYLHDTLGEISRATSQSR
ncbi:hypothetical protein ACFLUO_06800 [Chloroflexota bacterium]